MIRSGRKKDDAPKYTGTPAIRRSPRLVAILGILVFTVFICSSVTKTASGSQASTNFGEGAHAVFAPVGGDVDKDSTDTAVIEDSSIWAYLESVIARLIYGDL